MGLMSEETFLQLLSWLPGNTGVTFSGMGEALMNPACSDYVKALLKKNIVVILKTNGQLLTPSVYDRLLEAGIWQIQISVPAIDKKDYETKMQGGNFDKLLENLAYISAQENHRASIYTTLLRNEDKAKRLHELQQKFQMPVFSGDIHSRGGKLYDPKKSSDICRIFPKAAFIAWDGNILACCHDLEGKTTLGHISSTSIDLLRQKKWNIIKNNTWFDMCKKCDDKMRDSYFSQESQTILLKPEQKLFLR